MKIILLAFILVFFMSCVQEEKSKPETSNPVLTIEGGQVQGISTETEGVYVYRGIPFAAAPVGDLRWKAPQPVTPWDSLMIADTFCAPCYQGKHKEGEFYQKEFFFDGDPPYSEDCLALNVWTPVSGKSEEKLPVAMWIHGGAYLAGWGFEPEMDGEAWAERGVILVTINYRLGIFGFLAHPELSAESPDQVSGNYGTLDQIAALTWIKNNISQFGGDPDNITIFGQSAGGNSIKQLVTSSMSKDKVAKAIIMSGGGVSKELGAMNSMSLENAETLGKTIMDFGGYSNLEDMRSASSEEVFQTLQGYGASIKQWVRLGPVIDGHVLNQSFSNAAFDGNIADIPYMIGFTMDDISFLANPEEINTFAQLCEEKGKDVYAYQFARPLPGDESGAFHSSELWFVFHTLKHSWRPFTQGDDALSNTMVDAWANFAVHGNPNGKGDEKWSAYTQENRNYMIFKLDENDQDVSEMGEPLPPSVESMF